MAPELATPSAEAYTSLNEATGVHLSIPVPESSTVSFRNFMDVFSAFVLKLQLLCHVGGLNLDLKCTSCCWAMSFFMSASQEVQEAQGDSVALGIALALTTAVKDRASLHALYLA